MKEVLYGRQPVHEVFLAGRRQCVSLFLLETSRNDPLLADLAALAREHGVPCRDVSRSELDRMASGGNHQGAAAEVEAYPYVSIEDILAAGGEGKVPPIVIVADHIQDPQNLGGLLRSAETAGVAGVVIPKDRAAEVTSSAVRASSGAAEHVKVARVTNLTRALELLKENEFWVAGLESGAGAKVYTDADLNGPLVLVVGNEGAGLSRLVRDTCDFLVHIPMWGKVASLNAQVAAAVVLYEARRQAGSTAAPGSEGPDKGK